MIYFCTSLTAFLVLSQAVVAFGESVAEGRRVDSFKKAFLLHPDTVSSKSASKALGMSLLLPGTGQLYAGHAKESFFKGVGFLGAEVVSWVLYFNYKNKGKSKDRQFKRYAEENWNIDAYVDYLESYLNLPSGYLGVREYGSGSYRNPGIDADRLYQAEEDWAQGTGVAVHHLFGSGEQQYYEMIYKYPEQFALGWGDVVQPGPAPGSPTGYDYNHLSGQMIAYRSMRNRSNQLLGYARAMTGVMMVNRILSGLDAVWTVKRHNRLDKMRMGFRLNNEWIGERYVTLPSVSFIF